jgi:hypothetical protein
MGRCEMYF